MLFTVLNMFTKTGLQIIFDVAQSSRLFATPWTGSPPGSSVHEIFQARILEWAATSFSRGSSQPRDWTQVSCTAGRFFTDWATREATLKWLSANVEDI